MKNIHQKNLYVTIIGLLLFVTFAEIYSKMSVNLQNKDQATIYETNNITIGLLQYTSHPSLDLITQGIMDTLELNGYKDGDTVTIDFQNAQADQSNLNTMARRFVSIHADLMIGVATPSALALANASKDIPILLGAITDPEHVGLVNSNEIPGANITGVSDMTPIEQQIDLIKQLQPEAKILGLLYSSSEDNAVLQGDLAEVIASRLGFEVVTRTVSSTNDVNQVMQQLISEVDAIWTPNDNVIASAFPNILDIALEAKVPVYPAVDMMVAQGGIATLGLNQYQIGVETGEMAVELLEGTIKTATAPIRFANITELVINYEIADYLNIDIPHHLSEEAIDSKTLMEGE